MLPNPIPTVLRSFCLENERDDHESALKTLHALGLTLLRFRVRGPKKNQSAEVSAEEGSGKVSGLLNACLVAAKARVAAMMTVELIASVCYSKDTIEKDTKFCARSKCCWNAM